MKERERSGYPRPQALSSKMGGEENLVTSREKVVDFCRFAVVVPIRLQNETTRRRDILCTQQKIVNLKMNL